MRHAGGGRQQLTVLQLSQSVDDTAWVTSPRGALFVSDPTNDHVDVITGPFRSGQAFVGVTPCDANNAPSNCAPNYLGTLNLRDGTVSPVTVAGVAVSPQGALFVGRTLSR